MRNTLLTIISLFAVQFVTAQTPDTALSILSDSARRDLLNEVTVTGKKSFIQVLPDRMLINADAAITNSGATLLELLEKSPGITIDRSGNISLKGRQGVLIMIDGKPAQLSGSTLTSLLEGMAAAQVDQIEIFDNPPAKFDAAGNAGLINIKTKKNKQKGFNGNINTSYTQGKLAKTFNSFGLNYNSGRINLFSNFTANYNQNFTDLYAIRRYYTGNGSTVISELEQPSYFKWKAPAFTIKSGLDFLVDKKTTLGIVATHSGYNRKGTGSNPAVWMSDGGNKDSVIVTDSRNEDRMRNYAININARHVIDAGSELTADVDFVTYRIDNSQLNNNTRTDADIYEESIIGDLGAAIDIITGKADYRRQLSKDLAIETGWKSSHINTNNSAEYFTRFENITRPDFDKTNHFIYRENIHAVYASGDAKSGGWSFTGGLRYEQTSYDARQLGNEMRSDSSFSQKYAGLFPSFTAAVEVDSANTLSFSGGRRIDRPPFQSLNPFVFIINKYTYQAGNPYYRPQYTWNLEVSHSFKNILVTSISYSRTKDYFSQIFLQDSTGIIRYTEGNLGRMENVGLSFNFQHSLASWWSLSAMTAFNYKMIRGFVWNNRNTARLQANFNMNNQFDFGQGWSGELSGFLQLHEQELQEITDPTGQVGLGIAKQIFKSKGSLKFSLRDIFYSQAMKGYTVFENSDEYFRIKRDSRVASIAFAYRFGNSTKKPVRRSTGGAEEEMKRADR